MDAGYGYGAEAETATAFDRQSPKKLVVELPRHQTMNDDLPGHTLEFEQRLEGPLQLVYAGQLLHNGVADLDLHAPPAASALVLFFRFFLHQVGIKSAGTAAASQGARTRAAARRPGAPQPRAAPPRAYRATSGTRSPASRRAATWRRGPSADLTGLASRRWAGATAPAPTNPTSASRGSRGPRRAC
ncbi:hypothetical protein PG994_014671 [Apiospora phragmitis]|uniref:Ubiquitin-like domain-containing protein n=1 Tax=Apiospora phragmitis TaxID=2905665 RepID=A0ABR1SUB1_9PEZI